MEEEPLLSLFEIATTSRNVREVRLQRSLRYQRSLDVAKQLSQQRFEKHLETRFGNNDSSGKPSILKPRPRVVRTSRLSYWEEGVPAMPWRSTMELTTRYSPPKKAERPAFATV